MRIIIFLEFVSQIGTLLDLWGGRNLSWTLCRVVVSDQKNAFEL